jgi:succinylglutamate desuccinylase
LDRVLGRLGEAAPGAPTLIVVGGLHGNEPAGVEASRRVTAALEDRRARLRGPVVFVAGNLQALARRRRFIDRDLNRAWTSSRVQELLASNGSEPSGEPASAEDVEQRELLAVIDGALETADGPVFVLDLHTTSGTGGAFSTVADTLRNRAVALQLPVPLVLGLEELVEGTLHEYLGTRGCITVAFESGQHDEDRAADRAEAAIWILLAATGVMAEVDLPELTAARKSLARDAEGLPRVFEMRYRHPVENGDAFRMRPGYQNFQPVRRSEAVGDDVDGPVEVPENGRMLMPLYQDQGQDGFFVVREFNAFWLSMSRILREIGFQRYVHWLPGIRLHPDRPDALVVDRRVARFYALQVLHLLGYRRHAERGSVLEVLRQNHD